MPGMLNEMRACFDRIPDPIKARDFSLPDRLKSGLAVYLDRPDEVVIVDILHSRSDLHRHVAALTALKHDGS